MLFTLRPADTRVTRPGGCARATASETSRRPTAFLFHLEAERDVDRLLSKDAKGAILYIVEEASANARKHAEATNLWVRLYQRGMSVVAEVERTMARGFDVAAMEADYANRGSLG